MELRKLIFGQTASSDALTIFQDIFEQIFDLFEQTSSLESICQQQKQQRDRKRRFIDDVATAGVVIKRRKMSPIDIDAEISTCDFNEYLVHIFHYFLFYKWI